MESQKNKTIVSWTAPEYPYYKKTQGWLAGLGIISAALLIASLLMKNYFFAVLIPVASFLIYIYAQKRPRQITVRISEETVDVGENLSFFHKEIASFWVADDLADKSLILETKKFLQPKISLLLADQDPEEVRQALLKFTKEKRQNEHFADIIAKRLKF